MIRLQSRKDLGPLVSAIRQPGEASGTIARTVAGVLRDVCRDGDEAVRKYSEKFDGVAPKSLRVSAAEMKKAVAQVPREIVTALEKAAERIFAFHEAQRRESITVEGKGYRLTERITPLRRAGVYAPGGLAAYPSTVLMDVIPAKVAGCEEIVLCSSPKAEFGGSLTPVILAAAQIVGVDEIYKVGGAQAVAALAYGTRSIPRVDIICGPGNVYVTEAKKQVQGIVKIDSLAGPSEVLIIADGSAKPEYVAADLLAQMEHASGACGILVTPEKELFRKVEKELKDQVARSKRKKILEGALEENCFFVRAKDLPDACRIANAVAPEHLEVMTRRPKQWVKNLRNAGAIFVGELTPEPLGDYTAGPNHVLPTGGCARFASPLNVDDFLKKTSVLEFEREGFDDIAELTVKIAESEGLDAHAESVRVRMGD
jgi:histidinol dehydrogenase